MKSKLIIVTVAALIIISVLISTSGKPDNSILTVGAVLPMTGPAALWGETFKNGMELALEGKNMEVLYEDSKSTAADGISAYNLLLDKQVDLTISELSIVAVPLSKIALERQSPLLVSLVAAKHESIVNEYTTRYYTDPTNYATPAFTDSISPVIASKKIALLYRNDELGTSVKDKIVELAAANGKEIVSLETFTPAEKDFRTVISKAKGSGADVFMFVASTPGEAVGIVTMASQLELNIPIVESSAVFADLDTRKQVAGISFYSTSYDFSLADKAVDFKTKYKEKFGKEPNFGSAFGYDLINLIGECNNTGKDVRKCLTDTTSIEGASGIATQTADGDFVVKMHLEKVN